MSRTEAVVSATLPVVPILIPLAIHFVLVSFVLVSVAGYLPGAYSYTHLILFLVGLWACHDKTSVIAAISVIAIVLFTMLLDIIQLGLYFPSAQFNHGSGETQTDRTWQFAAGMSIINLLFKPVTIALTCIAVYVRAGGALPGGLGGSGTAGRDSYSTIHGSTSEGDSN